MNDRLFGEPSQPSSACLFRKKRGCAGGPGSESKLGAWVSAGGPRGPTSIGRAAHSIPGLAGGTGWTQGQRGRPRGGRVTGAGRALGASALRTVCGRGPSGRSGGREAGALLPWERISFPDERDTQQGHSGSGWVVPLHRHPALGACPPCPPCRGTRPVTTASARDAVPSGFGRVPPEQGVHPLRTGLPGEGRCGRAAGGGEGAGRPGQSRCWPRDAAEKRRCRWPVRT